MIVLGSIMTVMVCPLGRSMYHVLINEMVRVKSILDAKVVPEEYERSFWRNLDPSICSNGADCGDPGWGRESKRESSMSLAAIMLLRACRSRSFHDVGCQVVLRAW